MQSLVLARIPSTQFLKPKKPQNHGFLFQPIFSSPSKWQSSRLIDGAAAFNCQGPLSPSSRSLHWVTSISGHRRKDLSRIRACSASESARESGADLSGLLKTLELGLLFGLWYLVNVYINILNKQILKVFPYPMTITVSQFAVGTVLVILMWSSNLYKKPKISSSQLVAILPLAIVHTLGNLFTNMSIGKVAVSFTHTIKASEPFFSVLLSALFLGELPTLWVISSLVPIVGGVALASCTDASFNWAGFITAMASNISNQSRNVFSKKFMVRKEESLDNITLFSVMTIMSFLMLTPMAIFMDGIKFSPSYLQSSGLNMNEIYTKCLMAGFCFHSYQQVSYMILSRVSPVSHSVGSCVKRVVVIVASVLFFRTPVSPINSLGTGIALAGVFMYTRVKRIKPKNA